jgi:FkbM family methyltransferase
MNRSKLFDTASNLLPPFIFNGIVRSGFLQRTITKTRRLAAQYTPAVVTITGGDLAGYKLKLDPKGVWQHEMISGIYDHELFAYIKKLELSGKVVYDIGAHICYHSLAFATYVGDTGHVYAFEPNPANIARGNEIIALNPTLAQRITTFNAALSNESGSTTFLSTDDIEGGSSTGGFIDDAATLWERSRYVQKVGFTKTTVALETIDALVANSRMTPPHLMKIDVEGAEQLVLAGADATLRTYHPTIIIEFHSIYSAYQCMSLLQKYSYTTELLKREPDGRVMIIAK